MKIAKHCAAEDAILRGHLRQKCEERREEPYGGMASANEDERLAEATRLARDVIG